MTAHARLSPSSAHRWLLCPGSVNLCEGLSDDPTLHSSEGTAAHKLSDKCFTEDTSPFDYVGKKVKADGRVFTITKKWARALEPGIERIRDFGGKFFGEHKVDLSHWMPGQFGTLDRGVVTKKLIVVGDLKFGSGVGVSPRRNVQLMIYALGFWWNIARHETKARKVLIIIDQPRFLGEGGGGEWYTTVDELLEFGEELREKAKLTYEKDAPLVAGLKQCEFCPAAKKGLCPAYTKFNMELIGKKFKDLDREARMDADRIRLPNIDALTPQSRSFIIKHTKMITKWLEVLHMTALNDAKAGRPTPGLKLVVGRKGSRYWSHPKKAEKRLKDLLGKKAYKFSLKSPTDVEKELSPKDWRAMQELIDQGKGKPSLVDASDARSAIVPTIAKFKNLDER